MKKNDYDKYKQDKTNEDLNIQGNAYYHLGVAHKNKTSIYEAQQVEHHRQVLDSSNNWHDKVEMKTEWVKVDKLSNSGTAEKYLQKAADMMLSHALSEYAALIEKKNKQAAIFYYCKAALTEDQSALLALKKKHPHLFDKLTFLVEQLKRDGLIINQSFVVLMNDSKELCVDKVNKINDVVAGYKALMDIYSYICSKSETHYQQDEKRNDFAKILHILTVQPIQASLLLTAHQENTKEKFWATDYAFFFGSQHYRNIRQSSIGALKNVDPNHLKCVTDVFLKAIRNDASVKEEKAAQVLLDHYEKEKQTNSVEYEKYLNDFRGVTTFS